MKSHNDNINLQKNTNITPNDKLNDNSNKSQKDKLKLKLMSKYNISSEEAERIIIKIEQRKPKNIQEINYSNNKSSNKANTNQLEVKHENTNVITQKNTLSKITKTQQTKQRDVDTILSDMLPNYEQQVSIEVKHVDLTFDVVTDKIDNIKEKFIRTIKRNKTEKLKFKVLQDINFKIYKGEKIGIIGYNGAGKSTLLHVIAGIYPPDNGEVITYGNISPLLSLGSGFDFNYSGRKNIYLNGAVLGYDKQFLKEKESEIIEFSELEDFIDIPIKNYSTGMLAKLGFSIATIVNPDILIIDEILSVGDVTFQKKSRDKIRSLMDDGTTVILVSHSIQQIKEICDKAIWIDKGHVKQIGEVNKVCDSYIEDSKNASKEQIANIQFTTEEDLNEKIYFRDINNSAPISAYTQTNNNTGVTFTRINDYKQIKITKNDAIIRTYENIIIRGDFEATIELKTTDYISLTLYRASNTNSQLKSDFYKTDWIYARIRRKGPEITIECSKDNIKWNKKSFTAVYGKITTEDVYIGITSGNSKTEIKENCFRNLKIKRI